MWLWQCESNKLGGTFYRSTFFFAAEEQQEFFSIPNIDLEKTYTMVESEAYFEAYRHVLLGLQGSRSLTFSEVVCV